LVKPRQQPTLPLSRMPWLRLTCHYHRLLALVPWDCLSMPARLTVQMTLQQMPWLQLTCRCRRLTALARLDYP